MSSSPPKAGRPQRGAPTVLAIAALLWTVGCGKQGPPSPPLRAIPAPTKDLAVVQQGPRLLLSFSYPTVTPAGTALQGISAVEIFQAARPAADGKANPMDPREFNAAARPQQKLSGADLTAATEGTRISVLLPLPEAAAGSTATGTTTTGTAATAPTPQAQYFAIRTYGKDGDKSELSNVAALVPKAPPPAPERVTVTARADGVMVEWSPVQGATAGYNVYRRGAQERAYGRPVHTAGAQETSWLDATARFGQSYIYTVTALAQQEPVVESGIASDHEVRYQDRFAPPSPGDLVALAEAGRVRLVWQASDAEDIAGYNVYRRAGDGGAFERVTAQPVEAAEFADTAVRSGQSFSYRVTAVDQSGNESAPGGEVRAVVP
ncbi:MAG TPA: hypothetical protein VKK31_10095 [Thermoanaerobaculia bacterium]|nr:hypothetical protein [Thermoanaerobaculia bacterium]